MLSRAFRCYVSFNVDYNLTLLRKILRFSSPCLHAMPQDVCVPCGRCWAAGLCHISGLQDALH